jgi:hypothetical protein
MSNQHLEKILVNEAKLRARGIAPPGDYDACNRVVQRHRADWIICRAIEQFQAVTGFCLQAISQLPKMMSGLFAALSCAAKR